LARAVALLTVRQPQHRNDGERNRATVNCPMISSMVHPTRARRLSNRTRCARLLRSLNPAHRRRVAMVGAPSWP
jgi:hypothetical protein